MTRSGDGSEGYTHGWGLVGCDSRERSSSTLTRTGTGGKSRSHGYVRNVKHVLYRILREVPPCPSLDLGFLSLLPPHAPPPLPSYSRLCLANSIISCYRINPFHLLVYPGVRPISPFFLVVGPLNSAHKFLSISILCAPVGDRPCYASYITSVCWDISFATTKYLHARPENRKRKSKAKVITGAWFNETDLKFVE